MICKKKRNMKNYFLTTIIVLVSSSGNAQIESFRNGKIMYEEYRYQEAEPVLKRVSEQGVSEAYYYLGKIYEDEFYMYNNRSKAAEYYKTGANSGNAECMAEYAKILLEKKTRQDSISAKEFLIKACHSKNGCAYVTLGDVASSKDESLKNYLLALDWGEQPFYEIASIYWSIKDYLKAKEYAEKAVYFCIDYHNALSILGESYYWLGDYTNAIKYLSQFYRLSGNCSHKRSALNYLGYIYRFGGHGIIPNEDKAHKFFEYAAFLGDRNSAMQMFYSLDEDTKYLSVMQYYINAMESIKDEQKKQKVDGIILSLWNKKTTTILSANENHAIGCCYVDGIGEFKKDTLYAIKYFEKAIELGSKESLLYLGKILLERGDRETGIQYLKRSAINGNLEALHVLNQLSSNYVKEYIGSFNLIDCFDDKYVTSLERKDEKDAYLLAAYKYQEAFQNGMLFVGKNTQWRYYEKTDYIYERSHTYNFCYKSAKEKAAECFYRAKEYSNAFELLKDTSELKTGLGYAYLGLCYYHGNGVNQDLRTGMKLLQRAAELGSEIAMVAIGNDFRKKEDYNSAVHWYRLGAHYGSREGMKNLALCYERGMGVSRNTKLAKAWMKKAAYLGDADANTVIK